MVERLQCKTEPIPAFKVSLADGKHVEGSLQCRNLHWKVGENELCVDALVLLLYDYDMILGMQWLEKSEQMTCDFRNKILQFEHNGRKVEIQMVPKLEVSWMSWEKLLASMEKDDGRNGDQYFLILLSTAEQKQASWNMSSNREEELSALLAAFEDIFAEPTTLPPKRTHEHIIHLKGPEPISVKPHRYPTVQKDAMEEMVREMLDSGIIRNCTSPFSAPMVLLKKKDGTWKMCVDYRELNKATVQDKFPMPVIKSC